MRLVRQQQVTLDWSDMNGRVEHPTPKHTQRAAGHHVSGILRAVALASNKLNKKYAVQDADLMPLCIAFGFAMEAWAVGLYPDMVWQPGGKCVDDIHGSIDGFSLVDPVEQWLTGVNEFMRFDTDTVLVIEEFKCTWKSMGGHPILQQWMWMCQAMAYCHMYGTNLVRFHVFWVAGNYKPPSPQYHTYLIEFSRVDLEENWSLLCRNKHLAVPEGVTT